ncbi:hypothetical protein F7725_017252 [Dissostichus mawsoni]|uniref:Protein phosphatase 1 regulatory subunit 1A n=1 Tax=Dissostichus mawsoni TaxID=36200 RepID=A0A7J5Z618_DISMA|nr:hypothetical protein F7725_017252 [Dissostichus mawsoni]
MLQNSPDLRHPIQREGNVNRGRGLLEREPGSAYESEGESSSVTVRATMDTGSPRKIQFTVPLLDTHLDPEAAEQIRRRRPTPATLVASSDQSSPEIDEDRLPNQLYKSFSLWWSTTCTGSSRGGGTSAPQRAACRIVPAPTHSPREELPHDDEATAEATAEAFEKLRCQMEVLEGKSLRSCWGARVPPLQGEGRLFQPCQRSRSLITTHQRASRHKSSSIQCESASRGEDKEMQSGEKEIERSSAQHKAARVAQPADTMTEDCVCRSTL